MLTQWSLAHIPAGVNPNRRIMQGNPMLALALYLDEQGINGRIGAWCDRIIREAQDRKSRQLLDTSQEITEMLVESGDNGEQ